MADTCHGVYNCSKLIQLSARSIHKQLFQYNLDTHGIVFDTFFVSSNPEEFGDFARIYYSAKLTDFEVYLHCPEQQNQVMCSFWRGLRLKNHVEQTGGFRYEWVIIMRPDIYFFRPFDLGELNKDLFYVANWCHATGKPIVEDEWPVGAVGCRTLQTHSLDRFGIPDFWFAASSANMDAVFGHRPVYPKGPAGSGSHGFILNVIQFNGMGLRIGRYLYHHLDYDFWRHIVKYNRLDAFENGVWWHKPRPVKNLADKNVTDTPLEVLATSHYQPKLPTSLETSRWSRCAVPRAFCFASTDEMKSAPYAVPWGAGYQETHKQKNPLYPSIGFPSFPWSIDSLDKVRCKTEPSGKPKAETVAPGIGPHTIKTATPADTEAGKSSDIGSTKRGRSGLTTDVKDEADDKPKVNLDAQPNISVAVETGDHPKPSPSQTTGRVDSDGAKPSEVESATTASPESKLQIKNVKPESNTGSPVETHAPKPNATDTVNRIDSDYATPSNAESAKPVSPESTIEIRDEDNDKAKLGIKSESNTVSKAEANASKPGSHENTSRIDA